MHRSKGLRFAAATAAAFCVLQSNVWLGFNPSLETAPQQKETYKQLIIKRQFSHIQSTVLECTSETLIFPMAMRILEKVAIIGNLTKDSSVKAECAKYFIDIISESERPLGTVPGARFFSNATENDVKTVLEELFSLAKEATINEIMKSMLHGSSVSELRVFQLNGEQLANGAFIRVATGTDKTKTKDLAAFLDWYKDDLVDIGADAQCASLVGARKALDALSVRLTGSKMPSEPPPKHLKTQLPIMNGLW